MSRVGFAHLMTKEGRHATHSICGQLSNVVPVKTVQLSPAFAKLTTGLLISVRKLMEITWQPTSANEARTHGNMSFWSAHVDVGV